MVYRLPYYLADHLATTTAIWEVTTPQCHFLTINNTEIIECVQNEK